MKAEDIYNVAIHLNDYEFQRLNKLIGTELKSRTKEGKKIYTEEDVEMIRYLIKLCFSKKKNSAE